MKHFVLLFTLCTSLAFAQQKTFTMEDAVYNQYGSLAPKRLQQLQWIPDSNKFSYINKENGEEQLMLGDASEDNTGTEVLNLSTLNEKLNEIDGPKCRRFPHLNWLDASTFTFEDQQNVYRFNISESKVEKTDSLELPSNAANRDDAPKTGHIAYTVDNNLYILKGDEVIPVSVNENKGIVSGQTVSRRETGITHGIFWSPDGTKLAYYVKDETEVTDYPIVNWTAKPASVDMIKYPMAGTEKTEKISVNVYDVNLGTTTTLKTGEPNT